VREFNIKEALAGGEVRTREGAEVRDLHLFDISSGYKLYGVVNNNLISFTISGAYICDSEVSPNDLFMVSKQLSGFIVIYPTTSEIFNTLDEARHSQGTKALTIIDLSQYNEGDNL